MNPPCAKCNKTVYPMEKLNCLDKTWHKGCFRCETCSLKLTLKTYKGYNKLPYCNTHYPTTKFTAVADTPENRRLAQNTQNQSMINYTKQHEEEKGKFTSVASGAPPAYNPPSQGYQSEPRDTAPSYAPDPAPPQMPPSIVQQPLPPVPTAAASRGPRYHALYDYSAADDDEVSFNEGDIIVEVTVIDDGWMEGRVERTGQYGMLPSNYVEQM